jgi:hypothetical protein
MENVVYLIGAGFSAPLGLPVMNNFLLRAKDMYFGDKERFKGFSEVFEMLQKIDGCKNYFETDLFNIEEVLSILEMRESLRGEKHRKTFVNFICEVIKYYTPELFVPHEIQQAFYCNFFGGKQWQHYGDFIASLYGLSLIETPGDMNCMRYWLTRNEDMRNRYTIVSLNYDLVFEKVFERIKCFAPRQNLELMKNFPDERNEIRALRLIKLHGCAESGQVIAPTWNKSLNQSMLPLWDAAHSAFESANHIRIIGYSLPDTDAYIKYLLRSAVACAPHLKSIDVICKDADGTTKQRYDTFIRFKYYRFKQINVSNYLYGFGPQLVKEFSGGRQQHANYPDPELAHENIMSGN